MDELLDHYKAHVRLLRRLRALVNGEDPSVICTVLVAVVEEFEAPAPLSNAQRQARYRANRRNANSNGRVTEEEVTAAVTSDKRVLEVDSSKAVDLTTRQTTLLGQNDLPKNREKAPELRQNSLEILRFLNEKTGRKYRETDTNLRIIQARLRSGASVQDCKGVIARKWREWRDDPQMNQYCRPATLFNPTKFEQYLGQREGQS